MPYLSGPACVLGDCPPPAFPQITEICDPKTASGGISELYFWPCTETFSEVNVTDPYAWAALVDAETLGKSGKGMGSIAKKSTTTQRTTSCGTEQITGITWALKFVAWYFDKTSARTTCAIFNEIYANSAKYLVVARMCDGDETILPIGVFNTSDIDWIVPDNSQESQNITVELSWIQNALPCTVDVPGLQAVVPK